MNISRTLLICLFAALAQLPLSGQSSFRTTYPPFGSYFRDLLETPDGGFLMAGGVTADSTLFLVKTDAVGVADWSVNQNINGAHAIALCPAPGGGYAVLLKNYQDSSSYHNAVLKIDGNGSVVWTKVLSNYLLPNGFSDIALTTDGALALIGATRTATLEQDFRLVKLDAAGDLIWEKTFGYSGTDEIPSRVVALSNGHLAVSGVRKLGSERDFVLARLNSTGDLLWLNAYVKPNYQLAYDLTATGDGGLVLLGDTYQTNPTRLSFLKVDGFGTEQWYRQFTPVEPDGPTPATYITHGFTSDAADNFYVPLFSGTPGNGQGHWLKIAANGDSLSNQTLPFADVPWAVVRTGDLHFAFAGEEQGGLNGVLVKLDDDAVPPFNTLSGRVFWDKNDNCALDGDESETPSIFMVRATNQSGESFYKFVQSAQGDFNMVVSEGDFALTVIPLAGDASAWTACDTPVVTVSGTGQTGSFPNLGMQNPYVCPVLDVHIGAGLLRRCSTVIYTVNFCNYGNLAADDPYLKITLDPTLSYQSSDIPLSIQSGNVLTFNLNDLPAGDCGSLHLVLGVSCDDSLGQTLCTEAHIFPDTSCAPPDPNWDGSNLEVSAVCEGSDAKFNIKNTGNPMSGEAGYVIIEDQIILMQGGIQLGSAEDSVITIPSSGGHSYYLRAEQRPGHPYGDEPSAALNACGGPGGPNLALQLPFDNPAPAIATHCDQVIGSFDPNDKQGFPLGWQDAHYLEPGQVIDYLIRFQNTGTDTAFTVVLRDTISSLFDLSTLRPGAASHPYAADFEGTVLKFTFNDILLPDSTTNEPGSHGYVRFQLAPRTGLPLGTLLENSAAIYFDTNEAVITNTWFHTLGLPLISFTVDHPAAAGPALRLRVQPNPFNEAALLHVEGADEAARFRLALYDPQGRFIRQESFSGTDFVFQRNGLAAGWYFYQLLDSGGKTVSGKIVVH